jgi:DeoR/GlpR family transcriptional regulator of sugar metabolism
MNDRHREILKHLSVDHETSVKHLTEVLGVSSVTIRQDLNLLEQEGLLKRVHGGAVLKDADDIANRLGLNYDKKLKIARRAAKFVDHGETVLIESGSVNALLARELVKKGRINILTTNIFIARQFRKIHEANIVLLGGIYQHQSESMVGKITKLCIDNINFSKAFIGIDGYTDNAGFTSRDFFRAEISTHIIQKSNEVFILSDSGKFGQEAITNICFPKDVKHVITDDKLDTSYHNSLVSLGVDVCKV